MGFRFIGQPFPTTLQLGEMLASALGDGAHDRAWIAAAWGKRSGLGRIQEAVESFRRRGGHAEVILGVDEGGATKEGLGMAIELFDDAFVFHDPGDRTFHPKIYVVQGDDTALAIVGSGNLTSGGLFTNFEAGVLAELDLSYAPEAAFLADVRAYYDQLRTADPFCQRLSDNLIGRLSRDPGISVVSEKVAARKRAKQRGRGGSRVFGGQAMTGLLRAPPLASSQDVDPGDDDAVVAGAAPEPPAMPVVRWWKPMSASDAIRKPVAHQRNEVALTRSDHPIDRNNWFRHELFGGVAWSRERMSSGRVKEVATVRFDVYTDAHHLGTHDMRVDHAMHRTKANNAPPTYLKWGELTGLLRTQDFRGWWLELGRLSDGTFRLRLLSSDPGSGV